MKWRMVVITLMIVQGLVTLLLFKFLNPGQAGLVAGAGFLIFGGGLMTYMIKAGVWRGCLSFWVEAVYFFLGAIPIYFMSLTGLGRDLIHVPVPLLVEGPRVVTMSLFIIPQKLWHKVGSTLYGILFVVLVLEVFYLLTMKYLQKKPVY